MKLFERIPQKFFSILTSGKKELYVEALFVLRQAFKTELVIRREDLTAMLLDSLEFSMLAADFTEEAKEMGTEENLEDMSGKVHLLVRKLRDTGWLEVEYERNSFDENITIPDYAIAVINLLYDLSEERVKEYNSYVYATYATLQNSKENPDYLYQALQAAYQNTVKLVDELKLLFNNIKRYHQRITTELNVNEMLEEYFDKYKEQIVDAIYYPLKTIDSVPRFKNAILSILNCWIQDDTVVKMIAEQGINRHIFHDERTGREKVLSMINMIADTYENIEEMISNIDRKHTEYTNASIDRIRYMINADRSTKGKLVEILKHIEKKEVYSEMEDSVEIYRHSFMDTQSLYNRVKRTVKSEGNPLAIQENKESLELIQSFLTDVSKQYSTKKVDEYMRECFGDKEEFSTENLIIKDSENFILFLLGTFRGREKSAGYDVEFLEGNVKRQGYNLPRAIFRKKKVRKNV